MRRHGRGALFIRAIHFRRHEQAVPMNQFRGLRIVEYVYCDRLAFMQPQDRTRRRAVVTCRLDLFLRGNFPFDRRNANGHVGFGIFLRSLQADASSHPGVSRGP